MYCCPEHSTCDAAAGVCRGRSTSSADSMSWSAVTLMDVDKSPASQDCPGGKQSCADGETCCQLQTGSYDCCPYSQVLHGIDSVIFFEVIFN